MVTNSEIGGCGQIDLVGLVFQSQIILAANQWGIDYQQDRFIGW